MEYDKDNKRIVLSALASLKEKSDDEIAKYIAEHRLEKVTIDDIRQSEYKQEGIDFSLEEKREDNVKDESEEGNNAGEKVEDDSKILELKKIMR